MSAWQPCGRRLRECIDDVCRSQGWCAWPPETPAGLDTSGKGGGAADSVSSEVKAAPSSADPARRGPVRRLSVPADVLVDELGPGGYWSSGPSLVELDAYGDFAPERSGNREAEL